MRGSLKVTVAAIWGVEERVVRGENEEIERHHSEHAAPLAWGFLS